ncbi:uncharacterized protein LOC120091672 isoform X2 [Benincasa hispida]|uniref:uncharacterized protein LOC120091672 isoform X2 n=1 Tax=Benincasa hispida TaxID=102211 RepID=UPI001901095F|nr:uncharacterized protein LOC120091672 isoform X2 [Benincasa hispida]
MFLILRKGFPTGHILGKNKMILGLLEGGMCTESEKHGCKNNWGTLIWHIIVSSLSLVISYPTLVVAPHMLINAYKNLLVVAVAIDYSFPQVEKAKRVS